MSRATFDHQLLGSCLARHPLPHADAANELSVWVDVIIVVAAIVHRDTTGPVNVEARLTGIDA